MSNGLPIADLSATGHSVGEVVAGAKAQGVLVGGVGVTQLRLVTHLDASTADCRQAAETVARLLQ
jgi:threonine aldolase